MQLGHRLAGGEREMSLQLTKFIEMWNPLCAQKSEAYGFNYKSSR